MATTASELKTYFERLGWSEARSPKYLHKEIEGTQFRVSFSDLTFRIEKKATKSPFTGRWFNVRSAYYSKVSIHGEELNFGSTNNDIFTEIKSLKTPAEIRALIKPDIQSIKEFGKIIAEKHPKTE